MDDRLNNQTAKNNDTLPEPSKDLAGIVIIPIYAQAIFSRMNTL